MWLPHPLYEALPVIYPAVGLGSLALFGIDSPASFSALLLFGVSVIIVRLRRRYRIQCRREEAAAQRKRRRHARSRYGALQTMREGSRR